MEQLTEIQDEIVQIYRERRKLQEVHSAFNGFSHIFFKFRIISLSVEALHAL